MKITVFFVLLLFPYEAQTQWKIESGSASHRSSALSGNFDVDLYAASTEHVQLAGDSLQAEVPAQFSPIKAGLLSAVVPGAGQVLHKKLLAKFGNFQCRSCHVGRLCRI